jgi:hypothetical protein
VALRIAATIIESQTVMPREAGHAVTSALIGERPCPERVQWLLDRSLSRGDDTPNEALIVVRVLKMVYFAWPDIEGSPALPGRIDSVLTSTFSNG